jgi:signal transduction histidine kinase
MEQARPNGQPIETLPFPQLANAAAALGHVHVELDPDGIARRLFLYEGLDGPYWPHLSLAMLAIAGEVPSTQPQRSAPTPAPGAPLVWTRSQPLLIPFAGPPGHFRQIPYREVIEAQFPPGTFQDRLVLIGTTAAGLGDALPTPFSGFSHSMSGVEINANILDALRRGLAITPLDSGWRMLASAFLALLPVLFFAHRSPRTNLLMTALLLVLTLAGSAAVLLFLHVWFPPTPALLAVTLSYPLWSWRRLELAMRYLSQELDRLQRQQLRLSEPRRIAPQAALEFASEVLPIGGWTIVAEDGIALARHGDAPSSAPAALRGDAWLSRDGCLWRRLRKPEQTLLIGLRWNDAALTPAQEHFLDQSLQGSELITSAASDNPERDLQARIAQVQQATRQLRELRRFIDDSLANMADGVVVTDLHGQVLLANERAAFYLHGDGKAQLIGLPVMPLRGDIKLDQAAQWGALLRPVILENQRVQSGARHSDGRDLLVQAAPLNSERDAVSGLVLNFSDISLLKASERKRDELINFLSHDLRAPLVSLTALVDLARNENPSAALAGLLDRVESHTARTLNLAEQFLQLARAESSESVALREVDMVSVAMNALEQVWEQAQARHIHLEQPSGATHRRRGSVDFR